MSGWRVGDINLLTLLQASANNVSQFRRSPAGVGGQRARPPCAQHHRQHSVTNLLKLNTQHA